MSTDPITGLKESLMTHALSSQSQELMALEAKLNLLIASYQAVSRENRELSHQLRELKAERAVLMEKAVLAKTRVEALITRLKLLERNS